MKSNIRKTAILFLVIILIGAMTGCTDSKGTEARVEKEESQSSEEQVQETPAPEMPAPTPEPASTPVPTASPTPTPTGTPMPEATVAPTPEPTVTPTPEPQEPLPPKEIEYGDIITVSYDKKIYDTESWKYSCSQEFVVSTASKQFQNKSEEITEQNIEKAIGKTAGDTFTIWVEEDGGFHGYEHTIVYVESKNADKIEYGDQIYTSYAMRGFGVDTGEGVTIHTGNQVLRLVNNDSFLTLGEEGYYLEDADYYINELLGKGIGHSFDLVKSSYEWTHHYKYRIHGIGKAVKYGDTIKTEVREVYLECAGVTDEESTFEFKLTGPEVEWHEIEEGRIVFQKLLGKTVGDTVEISLFEEDGYYGEAEIYSMEILSVKPGEKTEEDHETAGLKALMLADEKDITFIMESPGENGYSNGGWTPKVVHIMAEHPENYMTYEYYCDYYDQKYALEYVHGIEREYDAEGRVIKEINKQDWLGDGGMSYNIVEYQYDAAGNCIERVDGYLDDEGVFQVYDITTYQYNEQGICTEEKKDYVGYENEMVDYAYYNENGRLIREEHIYNGNLTVYEYDPSRPQYYKRTYYHANGMVRESESSEREYDEWGFLIETHY